MALTKKAPIVPEHLSDASDRTLRSLEKKTAARVEQIRSAPDPGKRKPAAEAQKARDAVLAEARDSVAELGRVRAEIAAREAQEKASRPSLTERFRGTPNVHERAESARTARERQVAERKAFHAEIGAAMNEKAAAERERKIKNGTLYQPVGGWDADGAAAVFTSDLLWRWTEYGLHPDGNKGMVTGVILAAEDILAAWWILGLIAENEGAARIPNGQFPRFPTDADGNRTGTPNLRRLEELNLISREAGPGYTTVTLGSRALELQRQFRDGWKAQAKSEAA